MNKNISQSQRKQFRGFPREYSLAPLWAWNDDMRAAEIVRQLDEMQAQHVHEAMIYPTVGLIQPYLSPAYFEAYVFALREAKKRGMRLWVYDDYAWPSGTAGGQLLLQYPEYRMPVCRFFRYTLTASDPRNFCITLPPGRILCVWAESLNIAGDKKQHFSLVDSVMDSVLEWQAPAGEWSVNLALVTNVEVKPEASTGSRWSSNIYGYLDVLNPAAVRKYIEMVYESHYKAAPEFFGSTMPGFFTDEPGFLYDGRIDGGRDRLQLGYDSRPGAIKEDTYAGNPALHGYYRSLPWTHDCLRQFQQRYGYDLRSKLPELTSKEGGDLRVWYDFTRLISDLFVGSYSRQISAWCESHKTAFTGHWSEGVSRGDWLGAAAQQQVPGIDILGGQSVFGKLITLPRQIASVARMTGRSRVLAETHGVTAWDFEMADKVRLADMLTVLGVNLHAPIDHAYSFRGMRKHTKNPPGCYHAPAWQHQKHFSDRVARLCMVLSMGDAGVETAILYPSQACLLNTLRDISSNERLEQHMRTVFMMLLGAQVESDFLIESLLQQTHVAKGRLVCPGAQYHTIILTGVQVLAPETFLTLTEFVKTGGRLILFEGVPEQDQYGCPAPAVWLQLLEKAVKFQPDKEDVLSACRRGGVIVLAADPVSMFSHSAVLTHGSKDALFYGGERLTVFAPAYPQEMTVDLGRLHKLAELGFVVEKPKEGVVYDYSWEVSVNGSQWKEIGSFKQAGRIHNISLDSLPASGNSKKTNTIPARYVRLIVKSGADRFFGLNAFTVKYLEDATGVVKLWQPPETEVSFWRKLAGADNPAPLQFLAEKGSVCDSLVMSARTVGNDRVTAVVNRSDKQLKLTAQLLPPYRGHTVEHWDLNSGEIAPVALESQSKQVSEFKMDLAPFECRVLALTAVKPASITQPQILARNYKLSGEVKGPWSFRPERFNAFPLLAGKVRFACPTEPEKWLPAENGAIPKPLRLVPRVMFECVFEIEQMPRSRVELLFEEDLLAELHVNGKQIVMTPRRNRYLDAFGMSVAIDNFLQEGRNRVTGLYMPEIYERTMDGIFYRADLIQPTFDVFLLGDFAVVKDRIVSPVCRLDGRSWQMQGYPYYSGTGVYTIKSALPAEHSGSDLWLEVAARNGVVELCDAQGRSLAVKIAPPYLFNISQNRFQGMLELQAKVTGTIGSLLTKQNMGALLGSTVKQYNTGLECVRLWI